MPVRQEDLPHISISKGFLHSMNVKQHIIDKIIKLSDDKNVILDSIGRKGRVVTIFVPSENRTHSIR